MTAMITPFKDGEIDYTSLDKLIENNVKNDIDILVCGTTAETATLEEEEYTALIRYVVEKVAKRVNAIAGCGTNSTKKTIKNAKFCEEAGADGLLIVTPYYNKPSQAGMYAHFAAIAQASPLPIILYNVPGRTGVSMTAETIVSLATNFSNITAVKEASGNLVFDMQLLKQLPAGFTFLSGDDGTTLPSVYMGGKGAISVIGIAYPAEFSQMVRLGLEGKIAEANQLHYGLLPKIGLAFKEGNPIGIKAILAAKGLCEPYVRLPLVEASAELKKEVAANVQF